MSRMLWDIIAPRRMEQVPKQVTAHIGWGST